MPRSRGRTGDKLPDTDGWMDPAAKTRPLYEKSKRPRYLAATKISSFSRSKSQQVFVDDTTDYVSTVLEAAMYQGDEYEPHMMDDILQFRSDNHDRRRVLGGDKDEPTSPVQFDINVYLDNHYPERFLTTGTRKILQGMYDVDKWTVHTCTEECVQLYKLRWGPSCLLYTS